MFFPMRVHVRMWCVSVAMAIFLLGSWCSCHARMQGGGDSEISVKGLAERVVKSDVGEWQLGFWATGPSIKLASQKFKKACDRIEEFLKKEGFRKEEISFEVSGVKEKSLSEGAQRSADEVCLLTGEVRVKTPRVDLLKKASGNLARILDKNVPVTASAPRYAITDFDALRPQMQKEATASAVKMADTLAQAAGRRRGDLLYARQGPFTVRCPNSNKPDTDARSLFKKLKLVDRYRFELKD